MTLNEYQNMAKARSSHGLQQEAAILYCLLGMQRGLGELSREGKKLIGKSHKRRTRGRLTGKINHELGNILWYVSELASITKIDLNKLARHSLENL